MRRRCDRLEKAAPGVAVEELVWLFGALWTTRNDLNAAFLAGYGRLSDIEFRALPLFAARLGVSYFTAGLTKREPMLVERGRSVLTYLARNERPSTR